MTMTALPAAFVERMRIQLGPEAEAFLASYGEPRAKALRLNPLKCPEAVPTERMQTELGPLAPVPWCPEGFYYGDAVRPGLHPYHAAGLYYIQEPSAMSAVVRLDPLPGETVLDLAAAPGGKAGHIAGRMRGSGLLIANEIHPVRAKILSENIERLGIVNAVVTNTSPDRLAGRFPRFFDRILLDAPCSGEGMFRKDPDAIREWSPGLVAMCAARQRDILEQAAIMLKPGGRLVYSTFSREENEETVERLTAEHPQFRLLGTERIWPHRQRGEGHFVAVLGLSAGVPDGGGPEAHPGRRAKARDRGPDKAAAEAFRLFCDFAAEALPGWTPGPGEPILFGEQLYWLPHAQTSPFGNEDLRGLKVIRPGLHLASVRKSRMEPAHALALAVAASQARRTIRLDAAGPEIRAYLRGESLPVPGAESGWTLVTVDDFPVGWGKISGGQLKNHYPKGLRRHAAAE